MNSLRAFFVVSWISDLTPINSMLPPPLPRQKPSKNRCFSLFFVFTTFQNRTYLWNQIDSCNSPNRQVCRDRLALGKVKRIGENFFDKMCLEVLTGFDLPVRVVCDE